ncbi:MAG TPA: DEAD/DEAH box helicase [Solirubrobacterales bacterium]
MNGLDFSRISDGSTLDSATEPRRIFSALPSKERKYNYPRDVQSEVWERWHERRAERDLVIKLNTGSGKTVVGLIALKSCLNEGIGPVAYITPDKPLTGQVISEARGLGLEFTDDPESPRFLQGREILIANVYKLFNGLSKFGVKGGRREPTKMGAVLIDDAHACLATVDEQYTLTIPQEHAAYDRIFELFTADLTLQSHPGFLKVEGGDPGVVLPIPFWAWADKQKQVMTILHQYREDDELLFSWPLLADSLPLCRAAVSAEAIEIAPACPPIDMIPSFDRAQRRLYLTATLSDDSVLVTHFGANPDSIRTPITPRTANDLGDRMILTPLQTFPDCDEEWIRDFAAEKAKTHNVVVIVPSIRRAAAWEDVAQGVHRAGTLQGALEELRAGHVGLVVLVNKYDGIDLPEDACHLLVLDGLPEALGTLDRLEMEALENSDALLARQVQRIEQGMGRGVRSNDDFCVVLLLGRKLTARLYPAAAREKFSPATRAQLDLSDRVAEMLNGQPVEELEAVVDQCLSRDPDWIKASRAALDGVTYPETSEITPFAQAQRAAFELAAAERFPEAAKRLQDVTNEVGDPLLRGLLKQEAASYTHRFDPVKAQKMQTSAFTDNRSLTRPRHSMQYSRLGSTTSSQSQAAVDYLAEHYDHPAALLVGVGALREQLTPNPDPTSVPGFEQGVLDLGRHLGLTGQRPERDAGRGPDVLWSLGNQSYLVIECKSGSEQTEIGKGDMAQLSQAIDWFEETYDQTSNAVPVLIHPSHQLEHKASARTGTRILAFEKLTGLLSALETLATAVGTCEPFLDPKVLQERLTALHLNAAAIVDHWTIEPRKRR